MATQTVKNADGTYSQKPIVNDQYDMAADPSGGMGDANTVQQSSFQPQFSTIGATQTAQPTAQATGQAQAAPAVDMSRDYASEAYLAAAKGDWGAVSQALNSRQQKIDAQGGNNRGLTNDQLLINLVKEYNGVPSTVRHIDGVDPSRYEDTLKQQYDLAKEQSGRKIDYATKQGIEELRRAEEDAQPQFQTMQNQIDIDEARAKDNMALYTASRGDNGGVGAAQYSSIMNTAAQNRLTVKQQQTKLSTDTVRQIADLRNQGEFQKADALLELTQSYLGQLMSLQQWAEEFNINVEEFNRQIDQWNLEYQQQADQIAKEDQRYEQEWAFQQRQYEDSRNDSMANVALAMLDSYMPASSLTEAQKRALESIGVNPESYATQKAAEKAAAEAAAAAKARSGNGNGGTSASGYLSGIPKAQQDVMYEQLGNVMGDSNALAKLLNNWANSGIISESAATDLYTIYGGQATSTSIVTEKEFNNSRRLTNKYGSYGKYLQAMGVI